MEYKWTINDPIGYNMFGYLNWGILRFRCAWIYKTGHLTLNELKYTFGRGDDYE